MYALLFTAWLTPLLFLAAYGVRFTVAEDTGPLHPGMRVTLVLAIALAAAAWPLSILLIAYHAARVDNVRLGALRITIRADTAS